MRKLIMAYTILAALAPSGTFAMSWCSERQLMFDMKDMCDANCPSACTEAVRSPAGSSGTCGSGYTGYIYSPSLGKTYALTSGNLGIDELGSSSDYTSRSAILNSKAESDMAAILAGFFGTSAWTGASDVSTYHCSNGGFHPDRETCESGCPNGTCSPSTSLASFNTTEASRFFWRDGSSLAFTNFAPVEPGNSVTTDDVTAGLDPLGEHWIEMGTDGTWRDAGRHSTDQSHAQPVIVQFPGALDCVNGAVQADGGPSGPVCSKDVNGDGQVTADEFMQCVAGANGNLCLFDAVDCQPGPVCPLGNYPCVQNGTKYQCSAVTCGEVDDSNSDMSSYQDDGARDPATGQCMGQIYIFNGKGGECKEPGVSTTWFQCCSTDEGSFLFIEKACGTGDRLTSAAMKEKRTHFVGTYCKKKFPLIGCVQTAQVHCIFESKLGRIIQEQGRMQLKNFQDANGNPYWGTPQAPDCRGFTPEEFQFLDFGKMDLSEFFADIKTKSMNAIQGEMKNKVQDYYDNTAR